jgi:hypothetical protein
MSNRNPNHYPNWAHTNSPQKYTASLKIRTIPGPTIFQYLLRQLFEKSISE